MSELTPELEAQIATSIRTKKPHLLKIEEEIQRVNHGYFTLKIYIRNGSVDKMDFIDATTSWLKQKDVDTR